jgi:SAM-dependent methyltransferase
MSELRFTGERFVPSERGRIAYEHYHRYATCLDAAIGKVVLDVASGEGYGTALLAGGAEKVIGVEIDPASVRHARKTYGHLANLSFFVGDCRSIPLKSKTVDLITSFETIEHIERQNEMIHEFVRLLRPNGLLIVSSPDRRIYSEKTGYKNPFHVHELARGQFVRLFQRKFCHVRVFRQRLATASFILPDAAAGPRTLQSFMIGDRGISAGSRSLSDSVYSIVVCSQNEDVSNSFSPSVHLDPEDDLFLQNEVELRALSAERNGLILAAQSNSTMTHALNLVTGARVDLEHRLDQANQLTAGLEEARIELSKQLAAAAAHAAHATDRIAELNAARIDLTRQLEQTLLNVRNIELKAQEAETRAQQQLELACQFEANTQDAEARLQQQSELARQFEARTQDAEARVQQLLSLVRQFELRALDAESRVKQQEEVLIRELEPLRADRNEAAMLRDASRQIFRQQSTTIHRLSEENKALLQRFNQISRLARYIPVSLKHPLKLLLFRSTAPD